MNRRTYDDVRSLGKKRKKKRDVFATEDRVEIVAKYQDVPYLRRINVLNLRSTARTVLGCCATRPPFPSFSLSLSFSPASKYFHIQGS